DWPVLWRRAEEEAWARSLALALAATDRWIAPGLLGATGCRLHVPQALLEAVPELLVKPLADRERDHAIARVGRSDIGLGDKLRRIVRRKERFAGWAPYLGWLAEQSHAALAGVLNSAARSRRRGVAALEDWLGA
ncbi:MAG: hypothetical protein ACR2FJ_03760, partial [Qipengyuania sp.]